MIVKSVARTNVGKVRELNEDNLFINGSYLSDDNSRESIIAKKKSEDQLFAVFDGMGGESFGEIASMIAVQTLAEFAYSKASKSPEWLEQYIQMANQRICDAARARRVRRMGSTVAILLIDDLEATVCNLGDSRIYLYDGEDLMQLSEDHRTVSYAGRSGMLTQHLGVHPEEFILEPHIVKNIPLQPGRILLLCSDGLTDMVSDAELLALLKKNNHEKPEVIADGLIEAALNNGGKDNVTVIVVRIEE